MTCNYAFILLFIFREYLVRYIISKYYIVEIILHAFIFDISVYIIYFNNLASLMYTVENSLLQVFDLQKLIYFEIVWPFEFPFYIEFLSFFKVLNLNNCYKIYELELTLTV